MLRDHDPIPAEQMEYISPDNTICETLRQIYHLTDNEEAKTKCRVATSMAKSMSAKLTEYNRRWSSGFYSANEKFKRSAEYPIDVLLLCWDDNANTGYRFWQCLKYLGLNAVMFKGKPHAFGYPIQAPIHPSLSNTPICNAPITVMTPGLESLINSAKVVHLMHSTYPMAAVNWKAKNVVVQHGGTVYRQNPEACNQLFNQFADQTIIQMPDLLGLGAKNEQWIYYPVDTDLIRPVERDNKKIVVGHFPSNEVVKGSAAIDSVVNGLMGQYDFEYRRGDGPVSWVENLKRMSECDIIIEACNPTQGDKPYGEWGNQCLEAAALGCSVITHCENEDKYIKEFGIFYPLVSNGHDKLTKTVTQLICNREMMKCHGSMCRDWAVKNHSIPATANRLYDLVYNRYF